MNITISRIVYHHYQLKTIQVKVKIRNWGDFEISGSYSDEESSVPFKNGDYWEPVIDAESGMIKNWPEGILADIDIWLYDDKFACTFLNEEEEEILSYHSCVPAFAKPDRGGYSGGGYISMKVDENGKIQNWNPDFRDVIKDFEVRLRQ